MVTNKKGKSILSNLRKKFDYKFEELDEYIDGTQKNIIKQLEEHIVQLELRDQEGKIANQRLSAYLSEIDYLIGSPNEERVSDFDLHNDAKLVWKKVKKFVFVSRKEYVKIEKQSVKLLTMCFDYWHKKGFAFPEQIKKVKYFVDEHTKP